MSQFQIVFFTVILILLIILSAFFSMAETGFMSINRYRLRHKARMKKRYAVRLLQLLRRPDRLLGTILIGNTFANMIVSSLATLITVHYFGESGALVSAVILTFIVLIFAEITPKTLAALYADQVAKWLTFPIYFTMRLMNPIVVGANAISNSILRLMRIPVNNLTVEPLSREEFRSVVHDTTGKIPRQFQNMMLGILDLSHLTVDDVMHPSHEIVAIDIEQPWNVIKEQLLLNNANAIPFYRQHVNHVIGVLYAQTMQKLLLEQTVLTKEILQSALSEPYFVPEGTQLSMQLDQYQQHQGQPAFVVDEYGEIKGMLTLNDILEEIVGDLSSNLQLEKRVDKMEDGSYIVEGGISVREFNRMANFDLPHRGARTLNGLIVEHLEALPTSGSTILIADHPIEIMQVKDKKVRRARIFPRLHEVEKDH